MARVIPATLELLGPNDLLGLILAGKGAEVLDTSMRRLNWHYATHAPALANVCPLDGYVYSAGPNQVAEYQWRCIPSADGRTYHSRWAVFLSSGVVQTIDLDLQESTSWAGPYTSVGGYPIVGQVLAPGINRLTFDAPLSGSTQYVRIELSGLSDGLVQCQDFALMPKELTVIPGGVQPSGFVAYNDSALLAPGAPVHTEYFGRAARGVRATARDLRQCVMSYVQEPVAGSYGFTASVTQTTQRMALTPIHIPLSQPTDVTVYCRAVDSGSPDGLIRVGQPGSTYPPATFTADDTDGELTLTLDHQAPPALYIDALDPATRISIRYVMVEWRPEVGSTSPIISSVAPPPLREYLAALDFLTLEACLKDYAVTGLNHNGPIALGSAVPSNPQYVGQQVQPGVSGMQMLAAVSRDGEGTTGPPVRVVTATSGAAAADTILIESPSGGDFVYPPGPFANVVYGSNAFNPIPTDPNGSYRLAELAKSRRPVWEEMSVDRAIGLSGVPVRVEKLADLPTP